MVSGMATGVGCRECTAFADSMFPLPPFLLMNSTVSCEVPPMIIRDILQNKGGDVYSTAPGATLAEAAQKMMDHRCGSLVVLQNDSLVGILSERDLVRACAAGQPIDSVLVGDWMTVEVTTGSPEDPLPEVMGMLTVRRIRHLPILEAEKLVGLVSVGDLVKAQVDQLVFENHFLKSYLNT
jgi:CBS domain-containing protein